MALQQILCIDKIEVIENGILQIRQRTDIFDDTTPSVILSSNYHRISLTPGQDLANQDPKVVTVANAVWTPIVIEAYQNQVKDNLLLDKTITASTISGT